MTDDRVALVTGAARGQGLAIVQRLLDDGLRVAAGDVLVDELQRACRAFDGADVLTLELLAQTARGFVKLGALVPDQPDSRMPSVDVHGTTTLVPSVLKDLGPEQATVSAIAVDDGESAAMLAGAGPPCTRRTSVVLDGT